VSRRGYYAWRRRGISTRERQRQQRNVQIAKAFAAKKARDGAPRLRDERREQGCQMSRKTLAESLRRQGRRAQAGTRFRVVTTDSNHALAVAPNLLDRDFTATAPNQQWAGDITYLRTLPGGRYLAVVLDRYSRQVVGYALADHRRAEWVWTPSRRRWDGVGCRARRSGPFRSRLAVWFEGLPGSAGRPRPDRKHEPPWELLGPCADRELLSQHEGRGLP